MLRADAPQAKVLKTSTNKKPVRIRLSPVDYPTVQRYRVTTPKGKTVCTVDASAPPLQCRVRRDEGWYRFRVVAATPQDDAVSLRMSVAVRVK